MFDGSSEGMWGSKQLIGELLRPLEQQRFGIYNWALALLEDSFGQRVQKKRARGGFWVLPGRSFSPAPQTEGRFKGRDLI